MRDDRVLQEAVPGGPRVHGVDLLHLGVRDAAVAAGVDENALVGQVGHIPQAYRALFRHKPPAAAPKPYAAAVPVSR